jgi:NAD dependent epimerase/dehydratase family enzyme
LILKSRYVLPQRLEDEGFEFLYPNLDVAWGDLVR